MIKLIDLNENNWLYFASLSVDESQKTYLASNLGIIARGYALRDSGARVIGIVGDDQPVGLALIRNMDEEPACYDLQQFMIDTRHQGKGYGQEALSAILDELQKQGSYDCVEVCVKKDDTPALHIYEKAGFEDTGYIDEDAPDSLNLMYHFDTKIMVLKIQDPNEKKHIARQVLEDLTDWFGVDTYREEYIEKSADKLYFAAYDQDEPVGFICLNETGKSTAEIYVMGVKRDYHRKGVGRSLFVSLKRGAREAGYSFLQVKTVQMGKYDDYDDTNRFYQSLGFQEFEVFPLLWDEANPCQIYVMSL